MEKCITHENARCNANLELAVQIGLIIDAELGGLSAWMFMASKGVGEAVIKRVLLHQAQRRSTDRFALETILTISDIRAAVGDIRGLARRTGGLRYDTFF